jgi:hypothetical protein
MHIYVKTNLIVIIANICFPLQVLAQPPFHHSTLDTVLVSYVNDAGLVDYASLQKNRTSLDSYIDSIGSVSPQSHPERFASSAHQLAYWLNAYNAIVLRGIIDAYPVDSVKDIKLFNGFFNRQTWNVGGQSLTLDTIENDIIRPQFNEPRIHFVLNCGAKSCPPLENRAFTGASLEDRLEKALKRFTASEDFFYLHEDRLILSKIIDWYRTDFHHQPPSNNPQSPAIDPLISYFIPHADPSIRDLLRRPTLNVEFMDYDWSLNEQQTPSPLAPKP